MDEEKLKQMEQATMTRLRAKKKFKDAYAAQTTAKAPSKSGDHWDKCRPSQQALLEVELNIIRLAVSRQAPVTLPRGSALLLS